MIDDSKHSREAYRVEQSLAARHYEKDIQLLERKIKVLTEALDNCKETLNCLGEPFYPEWSLMMAEAGVRGVSLTTLTEVNKALKEVEEMK